MTSLTHESLWHEPRNTFRAVTNVMARKLSKGERYSFFHVKLQRSRLFYRVPRLDSPPPPHTDPDLEDTFLVMWIGIEMRLQYYFSAQRPSTQTSRL